MRGSVEDIQTVRQFHFDLYLICIWSHLILIFSIYYLFPPSYYFMYYYGIFGYPLFGLVCYLVIVYLFVYASGILYPRLFNTWGWGSLLHMACTSPPFFFLSASLTNASHIISKVYTLLIYTIGYTNSITLILLH